VGPILRGGLCGLADGNADAFRHRGAQHVRAVRRHIAPGVAAVAAVFGVARGNVPLLGISLKHQTPEVVSEAEVEAQLKELGLPLGLIEHMQVASAPLDLDEVQDPYGLNVLPVSLDDTGK
jgi:hypothetical protein